MLVTLSLTERADKRSYEGKGDRKSKGEVTCLTKDNLHNETRSFMLLSRAKNNEQDPELIYELWGFGEFIKWLQLLSL